MKTHQFKRGSQNHEFLYETKQIHIPAAVAFYFSPIALSRELRGAIRSLIQAGRHSSCHGSTHTGEGRVNAPRLITVTGEMDALTFHPVPFGAHTFTPQSVRCPGRRDYYQPPHRTTRWRPSRVLNSHVEWSVYLRILRLAEGSGLTKRCSYPAE